MHSGCAHLGLLRRGRRADGQMQGLNEMRIKRGDLYRRAHRRTGGMRGSAPGEAHEMKGRREHTPRLARTHASAVPSDHGDPRVPTGAQVGHPSPGTLLEAPQGGGGSGSHSIPFKRRRRENILLRLVPPGAGRVEHPGLQPQAPGAQTPPPGDPRCVRHKVHTHPPSDTPPTQPYPTLARLPTMIADLGPGPCIPFQEADSHLVHRTTLNHPPPLPHPPPSRLTTEWPIPLHHLGACDPEQVCAPQPGVTGLGNSAYTTATGELTPAKAREKTQGAHQCPGHLFLHRGKKSPQ